MWSQTINALRRRWYLLLAGLLITAGLGYLALQMVPPTFQASGTLLLLPSQMQTDEGQNPLLELDGLEAPAEFVVSRLNGDAFRSQILDQIPTASYDVGMDPSSRGPVILVTASGTTPESVKLVLDRVLVAVPDALYSLQSDLEVPKESVISVMQLIVDSQATQVSNATTRAVVAAVGAGLVLTLGGTVMIDALLRRLAGGRRGRTPTAPMAPTSGRQRRHRPMQASVRRRLGALGSARRARVSRTERSAERLRAEFDEAVDAAERAEDERLRQSVPS